MKILIVYKKSFIESHGSDRKGLAQLDAADRDRLLKADLENRRALGDLTAHLARLGISSDAVSRGTLAAKRHYDLVISLGGDGTFFAAARYLKDTPLLGINSDPANSLGLWTCADRSNFREPLDRALAGKLRACRIRRMSVAINGKPVRELAFNDVLIAHRNPAAMTRYRLSVGSNAEQQRSSGLWISTAAGSTAGIRSAGGRRMPITSKRLQYLVREPYTWPQRRYRLSRGFAAELGLQTLTVGLGLWIDGSRIRYDLGLGDRVELRPSPALQVLGYDDARRRRLFP
ncbi:MAG: NAD(+)/NADH kinase [Planctomycetaceae bacterium]|nr:NAD(+)/NADH kinase [Planctomycetaceae bacterium]